MARRKDSPSDTVTETRRYGIGEWFGQSFVHLEPSQRQRFAVEATKKGPAPECPARNSCFAFDPKAVPGNSTNCTKQGGVCSLREFRKTTVGTRTTVETTGSLRTTCPYRFLQDGTIFQWIGEVILGNSAPLVVQEIEFLEVQGEATAEAKEIGYIDSVLVHPTRCPVHWCALEIQAVYFSGANMRREFEVLRDDRSTLPFPAADRHPDYGSSGPKRLTPQLQIKALRRNEPGRE